MPISLGIRGIAEDIRERPWPEQTISRYSTTEAIDAQLARVPAGPIRRGDVAAEFRSFFDEVADSRGELSPFYALLMLIPEVAAKVRPLGTRLRASVSPVVFDIVALAVAGSCACDYEMAFHRRALVEAGFEDATVEAIARGTVPESLIREHKVAATYAHQLARAHAVPDSVFQEAQEVFGTRTLVELSALVGYISMVSLIAKAFQLGRDR